MLMLSSALRHVKPATTPSGSGWWSSVPLMEWTPITNSQMNANLDNTYLTADVGASIISGAVYYGANEIGVTATAREGKSLGAQRFEYGGMATYGGKIYVGGGDPFWGDTAVHTFDLVNRNWTSAVIASTVAAKFDNSGAFGIRHRDGTKKGTHSYWTQHLIHARNWFACVGAQQFWPTDSGSSGTCLVGNLSTGLWSATTDPIPALPWWVNDANHWQQKHPITEDMYVVGKATSTGNSFLSVWTQATNTWSDLALIPSDVVSGSIDWVHNYIVFGGTAQFMWDINAGTLTTVTGVPNFGKRGGMWYCPDRNSHMIYQDDQVVTEITRSGTVFTQSGSLASGTPPANLASENSKAGGILNNWQYIPEIDGMALHLSDTLPMYYIRTL